MTKQATPTVSREDMERAFEDAVAENRYCRLGNIIVNDPNGEVIGAKVADQVHYSAAVISRVLKKLGYPPISTHLIVDHRKGDCKCAEK